MRYSSDQANTANEPVQHSASNEAFFAAVRQRAGAARLHCALLLVGGNDFRALAVRQAQASLRFDRRASPWSHCAVICNWSATEVGDALGFEVALDPSDARLQVPERNGATEFRLARYFDRERYPNLCVVTLQLQQGSLGDKAALELALRNPSRDRERYPLWNGLATWARYSYAPDLTPNPLRESVPLPAAAYCEYAFDAAGVDLTPGATANNACPELFWATVQYWTERVKPQVLLQPFALVRDKSANAPPALSIDIPASARADGAQKQRTRGRSPKRPKKL